MEWVCVFLGHRYRYVRNLVGERVLTCTRCGFTPSDPYGWDEA